MKKLNGWCSRCLAPITGKTPHEEASERKQTMCLTGIIRYRRLIYLGHVLRDDPGSLPRRALLRYAELERWGVVDEPGDILIGRAGQQHQWPACRDGKGVWFDRKSGNT